MSKSTVQKYRIEKVAPDGGVWGYLVAISVAIPLVIFCSLYLLLVPCFFGLILWIISGFVFWVLFFVWLAIQWFYCEFGRWNKYGHHSDRDYERSGKLRWPVFKQFIWKVLDEICGHIWQHGFFSWQLFDHFHNVHWIFGGYVWNNARHRFRFGYSRFFCHF